MTLDARRSNFNEKEPYCDMEVLGQTQQSVWEKMMGKTAEYEVKTRDPRKQASLKMFIENSQTSRILQPAIQGARGSSNGGKRIDNKAFESSLDKYGSVQVDQKPCAKRGHSHIKQLDE